MQSMFTNRQLGITNNNRAKSSEKLSSGYRINRAADDAAGLTISEKMRHKVRSLHQGAKNIQDGVSLCQIGDGALAESQDILQRINELSIKSANDTNTQQDREAIQAEVGQLKEELDRVAHSTSFNEKIFPLLGGVLEDTVIPGEKVGFDNVQIKNWQNAKVSMSDWPFDENSSPTTMRLKAGIQGTGTTLDGKEYSLIYDDGRTSYPSIAFGYKSPGETENKFEMISFSQMEVKPGSVVLDEDNQTISRTLTYENQRKGISFEINQSVTAVQERKSFEIKNSFVNKGDSQINTYMFVQNFDTAYGGDYDGDRIEQYFSDNNRITQESLWVKDNDHELSLLGNLNRMGLNDSGIGQLVNKYVAGRISLDAMPSSISIANTDDHVFPFSESIQFDSSKMGFLAVGRWKPGDDHWDFMNNYESETKESLADGVDISFTYASFGDSTLTYGVKNIFNDPNIDASNLEISDFHVKDYKDVWIQYSDVRDDGMDIRCCNATCEGLGMTNVDLSTRQGALEAIDTVKNALSKVSSYRSQFGADQNRLEHAMAINNNTAENTDAAESRIRDTDMAEEISRFTKDGIIQQAGQSMLAQANQNRQGILSLLQ